MRPSCIHKRCAHFPSSLLPSLTFFSFDSPSILVTVFDQFLFLRLAATVSHLSLDSSTGKARFSLVPISQIPFTVHIRKLFNTLPRTLCPPGWRSFDVRRNGMIDARVTRTKDKHVFLKSYSVRLESLLVSSIFRVHPLGEKGETFVLACLFAESFTRTYIGGREANDTR